MHIEVNENTKSQLIEASHYCSLPPEKLAALFVEDGLALYARDPDEFKGTFDGQTE